MLRASLSMLFELQEAREVPSLTNEHSLQPLI
jgi:hypothetical protein